MTMDRNDSLSSLVAKDDIRRRRQTKTNPDIKLGGGQKTRIPLSEPQDQDENSQSIPQDEEEHPLFMIGLPSSFSTNRGLAAIASLIDEEEDNNNKSTNGTMGNQCNDEKRLGWSMEDGTLGVSGGGKLSRRSKSCAKVITSPYSIPKRLTKAEHKTTISEAQVYLNLWKI